VSDIRTPVSTPTGQAIPSPRAGVVETSAPVTAPPAAGGDPALVGMPAFLVGSVALALVDINFAPASAAGAAVPIIMSATSVGMFFAAIWAARLGQNAAAAINGVFAGFWLSYAALALGLQHGWFAVQPAGAARTQEVFLIAWIVVIALLVLGTLRLPMVYTGLLVLVEVAFLLSLFAVVNASENLRTTAGWVVLAFSAVGAYLYVSALNTANGGRPYPLGSPILR
jgi:succinate-acetate transporter protein